VRDGMRRMRPGAFRHTLAFALSSLLLSASSAMAQQAATVAPEAAGQPSKFRSADDGWFDISGFLDPKYGFMPVGTLITEPAVGLGAGGGAAFINQPLGRGRPDISLIGGMGTENGSKGAVAGDLRYWFDGRLQTLAAVVYASVNLDFYGIGNDSILADDPLRYNLEPAGGLLQAKYRLGGSPLWVGLSYSFARTTVAFDAPRGTPGLLDSPRTSNVGGVAPSLTLDTRDNLFTPTRGSYAELTVGVFGQAVGGDDEFQRMQFVAMQYAPLHPRLFLGLRGQAAASSEDTPFYMRPFIYQRGVPAMRYQGEDVAQLEAELRWQFWKRLSLVGFAGGGAAWTGFDRIEKLKSVTAGGGGFRYELARRYGIHVGVDVAIGPDGSAFYIQFGSAWARP
jgi:hypothetical protein